MNYLNLDSQLLQYNEILNSPVFVDKSMLIESVNTIIRTT